jgi:hypothetical protein
MSTTNQSSFATGLWSERNIPTHRVSAPVRFIICNSCFWCTSLLSGPGLSFYIEECPSCKSSTIESMPIEHNEKYLFERNEKSGIKLEFHTLAPDSR